jgi:hypothetical protein
MLRKLLKFVVYILIIELICFVGMAYWIIHDGSVDHYDSTDAAFVPGYAEIHNGILSPALTARLDRAKQLLDQGKVTYIIVSAVTPPGEDDEAQAMDRYLQAHDVSAGTILQDHPGDKAGDSIESVSKIMKTQEIHSLLLIDDYYRLVHLKIRFVHGGEKELAQAHIGEWKNDDARNVMAEDYAIYKDMYDWYVVPESKELGKKAWAEAQEIGASVGAEIDTLRKK